MSTNCLIGKKEKDGRIKGIYCHYDGYHEYVGKILKEHYTDEAKVDKLLALGDISVLGTTPETQGPQGWDYTNGNLNVTERTDEGFYIKTLDYGSRGENCPATIYKDETEFCADSFYHYIYLFENGHWKDLRDEKF